jgi:hypothetical protein
LAGTTPSYLPVLDIDRSGNRNRSGILTQESGFPGTGNQAEYKPAWDAIE